MKFLLDAHLPRSLCTLLSRAGHDAIHTLDLPTANQSKDSLLNQISFDQHRIVISKDTDFFYSHLLHGRPWKLLLIRTGNISSADLRALLERNLPQIVTALTVYSLVELDRTNVIIVKDR